MSVIVLNNMGGVRPSTLPRALPDGDAQIANNLLARTTEFRPLQNDVPVATSPVGNPKTLYRTARDSSGAFTSNMALNWRTNAQHVNYVKGQVNDQRSERTYYTQADGSAPPRVFSVAEVDENGSFFAGVDKPLGVPPPETATGRVVSSGAVFTVDQRTSLLRAAGAEMIRILGENLLLDWVGWPHPGTGAEYGPNGRAGWLDQEGFSVQGTNNNQVYSNVWRVAAVGGLGSTNILSTYSSFPGGQGEAGKGVFDPRLNGQYQMAQAPYNKAWVRLNEYHIVVPIPAYGRTYRWNSSAVAALWEAQVKMPGTNGTKPMFTRAQGEKFLNLMLTKYGASAPRIKTLTDRLSNGVEKLAQRIDTNAIPSIEYIVNLSEELKGLSDSIEQEYLKIRDADLPKDFEDFYFAEGIDNVVPPGVPRILEDRFYIITYVTAWGEESAPSPVSSLVEVDQNDTVFGAPNSPPAGYGITKWRYYRTNTGNTGAAFQFVDEVTFSAAALAGGTVTETADTKKSTELGEVCPSVTWLMPPKNLRGLVGMPNGIMLGFFDNTVCPCESYIPYAYPVEYQMTTEYPIVGIGVFGQTAVVTTQGFPYYCTGSDPASLSLQKMETPQACVSARSIASSDGGVIYASPDGLCMASGQGVQLITDNHFTHEDWTKLNPSSIVGEIHEFTYYFMYDNGTRGCYALHMGTGKLTTVDVVGTAFYADMLTDRLYVVNGNTIKALFSDSTYRTAKWRSKVAVLGQQTAFAWLVIESNFEAPITVRWYGDGALVHTKVVTSRAPVRLPDGKYLEHEIEVESTARWNKLTFASSTQELQGI